MHIPRELVEIVYKYVWAQEHNKMYKYVRSEFLNKFKLVKNITYAEDPHGNWFDDIQYLPKFINNPKPDFPQYGVLGFRTHWIIPHNYIKIRSFKTGKRVGILPNRYW